MFYMPSLSGHHFVAETADLVGDAFVDGDDEDGEHEAGQEGYTNLQHNISAGLDVELKRL